MCYNKSTIVITYNPEQDIELLIRLYLTGLGRDRMSHNRHYRTPPLPGYMLSKKMFYTIGGMDCKNLHEQKALLSDTPVS